MSTTKIIILSSVIAVVLVWVVVGLRQVKQNDKKSYGDTTVPEQSKIQEPTRMYSFKDIVTQLTQ